MEQDKQKHAQNLLRVLAQIKNRNRPPSTPEYGTEEWLDENKEKQNGNAQHSN